MTELVKNTEQFQTMGEDANLKRWRETTKSLLDAVDNLYCQPYSICVVPEELRKQNESAYEPKVVSIGPRFKGKRELQQMEEIKWRCMLCLLSRTKGDGTKILETCMREMLELDATVRACYGEEIKLNRYDLATIMVYDGCFLLELAISKEKDWSAVFPQQSVSVSASDLGTKVGEMEAVLTDLTLLENQIPFFILDKLFQILFPGSNLSSSIEIMVLLLWQQQLPKRIYPAHVVELVHSTFLSMINIPIRDASSVVVDVDDYSVIIKQVKLNRCAARLIAAGVTIRLHPGSDNSIMFRIHDFSVQFSYNNGVLLIPHLRITQTTEPKWRSFIAWEHHRNKSKNEEFGNSTEQDGIEYANVFTFLALLFNDLICCASDVQILKNKGIIKDELGMSNHEVVDFFGSVANGIDRGHVGSGYSNIIDALNTFSATNFVTRFPIIACHDLSRITEWIYGLQKFLRRGYNFAAALITLLTVVQTCYAVLAYHYPHEDDNKNLFNTTQIHAKIN